MSAPTFRQAIATYIRAHAKPPDKFSHQPRLYRLAKQLAEDQPFDDDVLYAAAWLHDLGVFVGHRPEEPAALAVWDHVAYAMKEAPSLLRQFSFPPQKIPAVVETIRTHVPGATPTSFEGELLRDADLLEQLGAIGILRISSKVGRDTRFVRLAEVLRVLRRNAEELPGQLRLASAMRLVTTRMKTLSAFLEAAESEADESEL